jgi:hypothetical protein
MSVTELKVSKWANVVPVDLSLSSFHVLLPQEACLQTNPQLIIMAEDASQKPVQVKLVLLGTFPVLAVQTSQEQRPLCIQRPNAMCKGLTSFFFYIQVKQLSESPP